MWFMAYVPRSTFVFGRIVLYVCAHAYSHICVWFCVFKKHLFVHGCMRIFTMNEYRELYTARGRVWTGPAHIIAYWRWRRCFLGGHWAAVTSDEGSQEARGRRTKRGMGERQHIGWKGVAVASMDGVLSPGNVTPKETGFGGMKRVMEPQRN